MSVGTHTLWRWRHTLMLVFLTCMSGCAIGPSVPAGPSAGPGVKASGTWGYSYTPVTGTDIDYDNNRSEELTLNAGQYLSPAVAPMRASARASVATWLDVGYDLGWLDQAFQLRGGPLDASREVPFGLQLEYRISGLLNTPKGTDDAAPIASVRFEAYPRLFDRSYGVGNLVLALGASFGDQYFSVAEMPERFHYDPEDRLGGFANGPEVNFYRRELRLEAFLGAHVRQRRGTLTVVLAPHVVLAGPSGDRCGGCGSSSLSSNATHQWGISLLVSPGVVFESSRPSREPAPAEEPW